MFVMFAEGDLFRRTSSPPRTRVLIFSHQSHRDKIALLDSIYRFLDKNDVRMQQVIFCAHKLSNRVPERVGKTSHDEVNRTYVNTARLCESKPQS
jgi:hypothetical protein